MDWHEHGWALAGKLGIQLDCGTVSRPVTSEPLSCSSMLSVFSAGRGPTLVRACAWLTTCGACALAFQPVLVPDLRYAYRAVELPRWNPE